MAGLEWRISSCTSRKSPVWRAWRQPAATRTASGNGRWRWQLGPVGPPAWTYQPLREYDNNVGASRGLGLEQVSHLSLGDLARLVERSLAGTLDGRQRGDQLLVVGGQAGVVPRQPAAPPGRYGPVGDPQLRRVDLRPGRARRLAAPAGNVGVAGSPSATQHELPAANGSANPRWRRNREPSVRLPGTRAPRCVPALHRRMRWTSATGTVGSSRSNCQPGPSGKRQRTTKGGFTTAKEAVDARAEMPGKGCIPCRKLGRRAAHEYQSWA